MPRAHHLHDGATGLFVIFIAFVFLKAMGFIDWSWWGVCAPLLVPLVPVAVLFAYVGFIFACGVFVGMVVLVFEEVLKRIRG